VTDITQRAAEDRADDAEAPAPAGASMTIDELAGRTRMTVRNIRAYQSRGLVPPPEVRGRTGYYGPEHLARIELIRELQGSGFNLEAIRRLLEGARGSSREVLDFTRALREPFEDEAPEIVTVEELAGRWGGGIDAEAAREAIRMGERIGVLRMLDEGQVEIISPRLVRAGGELARLGVPLETALGVAQKLRRNAQSIARMYVELFMTAVWQPFDRTGRPEEEWPKVREALERLRPLATESLLAMFQLVMSDAVEEAFGRELKREARGESQKGRSSRRRRRR
jgi:DNA-binding transcriptional MerR regulator